MADKEAKLTVGIGTVGQQELDKLADSMRVVEDRAKSLGGLATGVARGMVQMAVDAGRAASSFKAIDFKQAVDGAAAFDQAVTSMAVRGGRDTNVLKDRFRDIGVSIGVLPQKVADVARGLDKVTFSNDAVDVMQQLGERALDTDRTLEEMSEVAANFSRGFVIPLKQAGEALRTVNVAAKELSTVGGSVALERTLERLGPLLNKFSGGLYRASALVGELGKGLPQAQAEDVAGKTMGMMAGFDPLLVTKTARRFKGTNYDPYEQGDDGMIRYKAEVPELVQRAFKKAPGGFAALLRAAGGDINVATRLWNTNFGQVSKSEENIRTKDLGIGTERVDLSGPADGVSQRADQYIKERLGKDVKFKGTTAFQRAQAEVEKAGVAQEAGDYLLRLRDREDAEYKGNRKAQAAAATATSYLPPSLRNAIDLGSLAAGAAKDAVGTPTAAPPTVELGTRTVRDIAAALRETPLQVKPPAVPPPPPRKAAPQ